MPKVRMLQTGLLYKDDVYEQGDIVKIKKDMPLSVEEQEARWGKQFYEVIDAKEQQETKKAKKRRKVRRSILRR